MPARLHGAPAPSILWISAVYRQFVVNPRSFWRQRPPEKESAMNHADFVAALARGDFATAKRIKSEILCADERALAAAPASAWNASESASSFYGSIGGELTSQMWADERAAAPELYGPKKHRKRC
jgi:hypothetical protein